MNKRSTIIIGLVILLALGLGYFSYKTPTEKSQETASSSQQAASSSQATSTAAASAKTVTYTNQGFSPRNITIKEGESVTFINQTSNRMWVAADEHPTHTQYAGTSRTEHCPDTAGMAFDQCAAGSTYTFKFTKAGTWEYHNHASAGDTGTITVTK